MRALRKSDCSFNTLRVPATVDSLERTSTSINACMAAIGMVRLASSRRSRVYISTILMCKSVMLKAN